MSQTEAPPTHKYARFDMDGRCGGDDGLLETLDMAIWDADVWASNNGGAVVKRILCGQRLYAWLLERVSPESRCSRMYAGYFITPADHVDSQSLCVNVDVGSAWLNVVVEPKEGVRG